MRRAPSPRTTARPKVVYNPSTRQYVLWVNYAPGGYGNAGHYLTATSATPEGPFAIANRNVTLDPWVGNHGFVYWRLAICARSGIAPLLPLTPPTHVVYRDYDLFRDVDGSAFVLYTCYCGPGEPRVGGGTTVSVVKLTPDYLDATPFRSAPLANGPGANAPLFAESPALFRWGGFYYALLTHVCCFCRQGGGVSVFTAAQPLGPWSPVAYDIGCQNRSTNVEECTSSVGEFGVPAAGGQGYSWSGAQQNNVFEVATAAGPLMVWTGDRWYSAADAMKGHDLQHWAPLAWGPPNPNAAFPAPVLEYIGNPLQWNYTTPAGPPQAAQAP